MWSRKIKTGELLRSPLIRVALSFFLLAVACCALLFALPCALCFCQAGKPRLIMAALVTFQSHRFNPKLLSTRLILKLESFRTPPCRRRKTPFKTGKSAGYLQSSRSFSAIPSSNFILLSASPTLDIFPRLTPITTNFPRSN